MKGLIFSILLCRAYSELQMVGYRGIICWQEVFGKDNLALPWFQTFPNQTEQF